MHLPRASKILVVDDDDDVRVLIRAVIGDEHELIEADDGAQGLALACTKRPDLILLDRKLPHLDGLQALKALQSNEETASIPVVFISAMGDPDDLVVGLGAGARDYFVKPFDPKVLRSRVRSLLLEQRDDDDELQDTRDSAEEGQARDFPALALGSVIADGYEVREVLGRGGMATVYRARHRLLDREVALKVIRSDKVGRLRVRKRFTREARLGSKLMHPNIIIVREFGIEDGLLFLVMDHCRGRTLDVLIKEDRQLEIGRALRLASQALQGLAAAHGQNVLHRDLKPSNMMVDEDDVLRLFDFGLAKEIDTEDDPRLTIEGRALGTPLTMSPEQTRGGPTDVRSDIYSMGCVLYELLTGRPPFVGTADRVMRAHVLDDPDPPSLHRADIHPALDEIVLKALGKSPDNRYQSAEAFLRAVRRA